MPLIGTNAALVAGGLLLAGGLVVGAQFLPPLTAPDADAFPAFQHYRALEGDGLIEARDGRGQSTIIDPGSYCRSELDGVDCACFRSKAVQVLAHQKPRASGWQYANTWELASSQAAADCR